MSNETRQQLFPIGAVSERTGILDTTLRIWERRYGTPVPVRLASGHRRYTADQIAFLSLVAEALSLGLRAGEVLRRSGEELERLLADRRPAEPAGLPASWEAQVRDFDRAALESVLDAAHGELGSAAFFDTCIGPLLDRVDRRRAEGAFELRHETFVSECVESYLRTLRARMSETPGPAPRGRVLIAALPGERTALGLQMIACVCAEAAVGYQVMGGSIPLADVAAAARELPADAVAISLSRTGPIPASLRAVNDLRRLLPPTMQLVVGGEGARRFRRAPSGVRVLSSMADMEPWLRGLPRSERE